MMRSIGFGYTDTGGRSDNEDSYAFFCRDNKACAVVADGVGRHGKGSIASKIAVEQLGGCFTGRSLPRQEDILAAMQKTNSFIEEKRENSRQMKTTAVCLYVYMDSAIYAHIGDSRLYHFHNDALEDYTADHSLSQLAVSLGDIDRIDIPHHPDRNKILRVLGDDELKPDFKELSLNKGFHAFLLCTDGFWEYLHDEEIRLDLCRSDTPQKWISNMRSRIFKRVKSENDNNTAVAVFVWI